MSLHAGPSDAVPWDLVHRGSFIVGRCTACGFTGPARRASYTVEGDMRAHEVLCGASRQAVVIEATAALADAADVAAATGAAASAGRSITADQPA